MPRQQQVEPSDAPGRLPDIEPQQQEPSTAGPQAVPQRHRPAAPETRQLWQQQVQPADQTGERPSSIFDLQRFSFDGSTHARLPLGVLL